MDAPTDESPTTRPGGAMARTLEALKALIASGQLSPGEQIRQEEMAEKLKVSRVPLREAMNVLAHQGMLQHRPNQGYFVTKRSLAERAQISRMLHLLENELITSIEWPDEPTLARLEALNAEMRSFAGQADPWPLIQLNRRFHFAIYDLSPHKLILEEVRRLWVLVEPLLWIKLEHPETRERTLLEHDSLIAALRARDLARCTEEMGLHRYPIPFRETA
jgi:DNA-binding GntR family transcriptional regulator